MDNPLGEFFCVVPVYQNECSFEEKDHETLLLILTIVIIIIIYIVFTFNPLVWFSTWMCPSPTVIKLKL